MQEVDALVSAQRVKVARNFSFHSSAAVCKIPAPYRGREGSAAQMGKVSFSQRPTTEDKFLNKNYEERKRQEGYDAGSVRMANGWGCNCLRPKGKGCDGSKPCPEWVDQRF